MNNIYGSTTKKSLAAYYAILAITEAATQACASTTETIETQLENALVEIAVLRMEVAALKADNAGLTKSLYDNMVANCVSESSESYH